MKTFIQTVIVVMIGCSSLAQTNNSVTANTISVTDITGKPLPAKGAVMKGSPMLNSDWGTGMVKLKSGAWVNNVMLQFNLVDNELYFKRNEETYSFADPVDEFVLGYEEEGKSHSAHFRKGYPAVGRYTESTFYEIAAEGSKLHLLKKITKVMIERNEYGVGMGKEYKLAIQWVIYDAASKSTHKIKRDVSSLMAAVPAFSNQIAQYNASHKVKSEDDFVLLIQSLNRLQ